MNIQLSVVIPAYNEAERLPPYLTSLRTYLTRSFGKRYEVIVVDDGSRDGSFHQFRQCGERWPQFSLLNHPHNQGKGRAVRTGMLAARGRLLLFTDADGATPIAEERKLRYAMRLGADLAVGSRQSWRPDVDGRRPWSQRWADDLFGWMVRKLLPVQVNDSLCGFKMFRRECGHHLLSLCQEKGYLLDVEMLALADKLNYRIAEVPVTWTDMPGAKGKHAWNAWTMLRGLWRLQRSLKPQLDVLATCGYEAEKDEPPSQGLAAAG